MTNKDNLHSRWSYLGFGIRDVDPFSEFEGLRHSTQILERVASSLSKIFLSFGSWYWLEIVRLIADARYSTALQILFILCSLNRGTTSNHSANTTFHFRHSREMMQSTHYFDRFYFSIDSPNRVHFFNSEISGSLGSLSGFEFTYSNKRRSTDQKFIDLDQVFFNMRVSLWNLRENSFEDTAISTGLTEDQQIT